jgi:PAS domain S-box-containing protein
LLRISRNVWATTGLTIAALGAAAAARALYFRAYGAQAPFLPFFPAIIIVSIFGGRVAGFIATFFSALLADLWMEPYGSLALSHPADMVALALFVVTSVAIVWVCERATRAGRMAEIVGMEQSRLAAIVSSSDDAIISKDLNAIVQSWNAGAERLFGYKTDEMVGASIMRLIPPERATEEDAILERLRHGEQVPPYQTLRLRKDGTPVPVSISISPLRDSDGQVIGASKIARDMSRQHATEAELQSAIRVAETSAERLNLALAAAKLGDWNWDAATDDIVLSERALEIFGVAHGIPLKRSDLRDMLDIRDRDRAAEANRRAVAERRDYDVEYRVNRPDGRQLWVATKGRGQYDSSGKITRMLGVIQDITERKQAEEDRERLLESERLARSDAEHASRMKDEFLATLSHELRTPLNAILGWAQILRADSSDPKDRAQGLEIIERNARAQTQIIEDLLDMSRIISGKVRLDVQRVDLTSIVQSAVDTSRPSSEAKGVRLHAVLDPQAGPITGDPNRLQQVFWNLISNAIKFTSKGGRIQVLLERVNSHVEVSVIDTGLGIKPEFIPYVFDRFRQADSTTTRRYGGLGIGLSIVKQLVELHGGTVRAKSAGPDTGSTFVVALPLVVVHPESEPSAVIERRHPTAETSTELLEAFGQLNGVKVLVVDDDEEARNLVRRLLEGCEAVVSLARSPDEALEILKSEPRQVLISDIGMPGEDGYNFIRRVRQLPSDAGGDIPALALTAYARSEDRLKALRAGFQMHLTKPVEPAELITVVAVLAGKNAARGKHSV